MDNGHSAWTSRSPATAGPTDFLSASGAAAILGISQRTIRRAIARGDLPAARVSGVYRIAPADLEFYRVARERLRRARQGRTPRDQSPQGPMLLPFPARDAAVAPSLPTWRTPLLGRECEIAALVDFLTGHDASLVTLTGPGGVGKTRLAVQAAAEAAPAFPDGVHFVPLALVRDVGLVPATILHALGAVEQANWPPQHTLAEVIGGRRILLVLDNFEHLLSTAPLVANLLEACPRLVVLVTSRARLNLSGEQQYPVPPLPVPDRGPLTPSIEHIATVSLFVSRARAADPAFRLTPENAEAVAAICAGVDGLPLAIELAAAQTRHFAPRALAARMGRRLPLLTGGPRDRPERHRTMAGAIAWSHDLLSSGERSLFRRLAVFVGGFPLEAADAVADPGEGAIRADLTALADHGLIGRADGPDGSPRFAMLETIREYALERLAERGEEEVVRRRHADYFLALAQRAEPELIGPNQVAWLDALEADLANVRAALEWLNTAEESDQGLRLAAALWTFWVVHDRVPEGRRWLEVFLGREGSEPAWRTKALVAIGDLAERQGDYGAAVAWLDEAADLARSRGDAAGEAAALRVRGNVAISLGSVARDNLEDPIGAGGQFSEAETFLRRSLALATETGDTWGAAKAKHWFALLLHERGDHGRAIERLEDVLAEFRRLGDDRQKCMVNGNIGGVAISLGDLARARTALAESLALAQRLGYRWWIAACLNDCANVAARTGEFARAARLIGAASVVRSETGEPLRPGPQRALDATIAAVTAVLGDQATAEALRQGASLPLDDAISEALAVGSASSPSVSVQPLPPFPGGTGLSAREVEVLRLLAEGHTDSEIANALFVGVRTARAHVASILAKLNVPTRTAAATHALRRGLI